MNQIRVLMKEDRMVGNTSYEAGRFYMVNEDQAFAWLEESSPPCVLEDEQPEEV